MLATALLALVLVPSLAIVLLVAVYAAGADVPEWLPPAAATVLAALAARSVARARGASRAVGVAFGIGSAVVTVGILYLLLLGLVELVEGPGGP